MANLKENAITENIDEVTTDNDQLDKTVLWSTPEHEEAEDLDVDINLNAEVQSTNDSIEESQAGESRESPPEETPVLVGKFIPPTGPSIVNDKTLVLIKDSPMERKQSARSTTDIQLFKIPDAPAAKKPRVVLEEDQYAMDVERIIQRDFFPDLEKLKAQNAYLSALENNDIQMLRELYSKYGSGKNTPRSTPTSSLATPTFFETPIDTSSKATPTPTSLGANVQSCPGTPTHLPMESPKVDNEDARSTSSSKKSKSGRSDKSLNAYLDSYTSEDNQSFQDFMDEADRKHKIKYSWLYDAERKHAENMKNAIALPSMEEQAAEYKRPLDIESWEYRNRNYIMYVPDGVPFTTEEKMEQARKKKEIILANTRFKKVPFKEDSTPGQSVEKPSPATTSGSSGKVHLFKTVAGKIGVDGKEIESTTPKVNGFSYVRTPSPNPIAEESPFMTWGEIEGTPFRLDGGDTPLPANPIKPYKILEQSKRERLGIELAEQVSQRYRDKKLKAIEAARSHLASPSPRPQSAMDRFSLMSPAARKFAVTKLGSRLTGGDKSLQSSYTPKGTPGTPSSRTPTPGRFSSKTKTPSSRLGNRNTTPAFSTDNLLKLPGQETTSKKSNRAKASDYF